MAPRDQLFLDDTNEKTHIYITDDEVKGEDTSQRQRPPKVTFHLVHVREFERVVGDHPEVKVGPPISLGWNYVQRSPVLLDVYDTSAHHQLKRERLTSIARKNLLLEYGFSPEDFRTAERSVKIIQEQRSHQRKKMDDRTKLQRMGRSFRKNLMRSLTATAKVMAPPMVVSMAG